MRRKYWLAGPSRQHAPQSQRGVRAASVVLVLLVAVLLGLGWGWLASGGLTQIAAEIGEWR